MGPLRSRRRTRRILLLLCLLAPALTGCSGFSKLDYRHLYKRDGWQLPGRVLESLAIRPGDQVADIGAGSGYFTFLLAGAVGPRGRVYAVDIDPEVTARLEAAVSDSGRRNIRVVRGDPEDPLLPDGTIDLVFLCNTYHHIENRTVYFSRLKKDLAPGGRVAIIDMRDDLTGILGLFADAGHWTSRALLLDEMRAAGYPHRMGFDFLPVQNFEIFRMDRPEAADPVPGTPP